jgi:hypothetical protein
MEEEVGPLVFDRAAADLINDQELGLSEQGEPSLKAVLVQRFAE